MSKTKLGDACAYLGPGKYLKIGVVYTEPSPFPNTPPRLSLKIDQVPVGGEWKGWVNVFPPKDRETPKEGAASLPLQLDPMDDDIPF